MAKLREELKILNKQERSKTNKGCVRFDAIADRWTCIWRDRDRVQRYKYFSVKKLGAEKAQKMAEKYRKKVLQQV